MKKALLLLFALMLCAGPALASTGAYVGLYADNAHMYWCASGAGFYPVDMWIWNLPGEDGVTCIEFMISYPYNVIPATVTTNWIVSVVLGTLDSGISVCYNVCQSDWVWTHQQLLYVMDPVPTQVSIVAHPEVGVYQISTCEEGSPLGPVTVLTNLYLNRPYDDPLCQGVATDEASWGAIKSLVETHD